MTAAALPGISVAVLLAGACGQSVRKPADRPDMGAARTLAIPESPQPQPYTEPGEAGLVDLQRQMNELRSDLLDEREKRIGRWQESNGAVLMVLGVVIGIGGLWAIAKFRAIAQAAGIGMGAAPGHAFASWDALPPNGTALDRAGQAFQPVRLFVPAGPEPGNPAATRHDASSRHAASDTTAEADSREDQEALAESTEAIRLDPDHPRGWIERGDLKARLGQYEGAIADYDRAIRVDPRSAAAYLNRSLVKSELGRHDEAIADLDQAMRLDPDMTSTLGDL